MNTDEIVALSRERIAELVRNRSNLPDPVPAHERRRAPRWPFPGTVEIYPAGGDGTVRYFGSCRNLSETGLGMRCEQYLEPESRVEIAIHLPEASLCGKAIVRYCMETPQGYMTGLEFDYSPATSHSPF